jgi:alpha-galactosidase
MTNVNRREFLQASAASFVLSGIAAFDAHASATQMDPDGSAFAHTGTEGKSWTVGNTLVEREICFDPKLGLYTAAWRHKVTGTDYVAPLRSRGIRREEFSFMADADSFSGAGDSWEFLEARTGKLAPNGQSLAVHLRSKARPIEAMVSYAVYDGHPVVRKWIAITNRGNTPIVLSHLRFESVAIAPGPPSVLQALAFYGVLPREIFLTGRMDDMAVVERNSLTGEGFIAMNEAPGWTKRTEFVQWGEGVQVMYDTDLFPLDRGVEPGTTFTSAKSSIAFFVDGKGFADPQWVMPSYTSQVLMKNGSSYQPPWIYNTWEPFERGITRNITLDLIADASRMGLDVFTIDDGWELTYGENTINRHLFPEGLDDIQSLVEQKGMRLGLWVPLVAISAEIPVCKEHPEWIIKDKNGKPKISVFEDGGGNAIMCLGTPYREVAAKRISDLIGRYNLRYVKIDLTTVFNAYGEAPGCFAHNHFHRSHADSILWIYEGIQCVTNRIYHDHPDVLLDLTYEVWGQKHIIDYGLLNAGNLDWLSNVEDKMPGSAGPRQARTLLYQRSLAIPTETMLIGNLQAEMGAIEERLATAMGAGPLFLGDLRKLTPKQLAWYGSKIAWFKQLRKDVPMLEGFFRFGSWNTPGAATWDGFARLSRRGEGMIALFKNESQFDKVSVALPVFPEGTFHVRSALNEQVLGAYTAQQLRQGFQVHFPPDYKVELLEIRRSTP